MKGNWNYLLLNPVGDSMWYINYQTRWIKTVVDKQMESIKFILVNKILQMSSFSECLLIYGKINKVF